VPNIRSAKKRMRQAVKRRAQNRIHRAALRTALKRVRAAATSTDAAGAFESAERLLDRAARKGLIAKNKAARQKHRLIKDIRQKGQTA
jgi:small subunit ribosomal protein S20